MIQLESTLKTLTAFLLALTLSAVLMACASTGDSDTSNCDQAFSSEERQECLDNLGD